VADAAREGAETAQRIRELRVKTPARTSASST
jgi:hypothetical protein